MNQNVKYLRKDHVIRTLERDGNGKIIGYKDKDYRCWMGHPSIAAAKRASRELQGKEHGTLQVVTRWPSIRLPKGG